MDTPKHQEKTLILYHNKKILRNIYTYRQQTRQQQPPP